MRQTLIQQTLFVPGTKEEIEAEFNEFIKTAKEIGDELPSEPGVYFRTNHRDWPTEKWQITAGSKRSVHIRVGNKQVIIIH